MRLFLPPRATSVLPEEARCQSTWFRRSHIIKVSQSVSVTHHGGIPSWNNRRTRIHWTAQSREANTVVECESSGGPRWTREVISKRSRQPELFLSQATGYLLVGETPLECYRLASVLWIIWSPTESSACAESGRECSSLSLNSEGTHEPTIPNPLPLNSEAQRNGQAAQILSGRAEGVVQFVDRGIEVCARKMSVSSRHADRFVAHQSLCRLQVDSGHNQP